MMAAPSLTFQVQRAPNKALQLTDSPLRGLTAAELGRYVASTGGLNRD